MKGFYDFIDAEIKLDEVPIYFEQVIDLIDAQYKTINVAENKYSTAWLEE